MRDPNRIFPFCNKLAAAWQTYYPDLRFWQFISIVAGNMESKYFRQDPFYAEESDWETALNNTIKKFEKTS